MLHGEAALCQEPGKAQAPGDRTGSGRVALSCIFAVQVSRAEVLVTVLEKQPQEHLISYLHFLPENTKQQPVLYVFLISIIYLLKGYRQQGKHRSK